MEGKQKGKMCEKCKNNSTGGFGGLLSKLSLTAEPSNIPPQVGRYQELRTPKRFEECDKDIDRMLKFVFDDAKLSDEARERISKKIKNYLYGQR